MPFHVVIAGAGVAGLEAALGLRELAGGLVSVELIAPEAEFTYRPLAVAEPFRVGEVRRFPLPDLVAATGATLRRATVRGVNPEQKTVTLDGTEPVPFDALIVALGAQPREAVANALTFRGPGDGPALSRLLERATAGELHRIAFVVPAGVAWPLPLYELALLTATYLSDRGTRGVEVVIVTPEEHPLGLFGGTATGAIRELLTIRGIEIETSTAASAWQDGELKLAGRQPLAVDAAVSVPRLVGPDLPGLPNDHEGFIPTDVEGRVAGMTDVYAAGDATQFRLKQGGLATQQADAVAAAIAGDVDAGVAPQPFRPVLRGLLMTGFVPRYLRTDLTAGTSVVDTEALWWPPAKIVGRYLAPFLAEHLGLPATPSEDMKATAVEVEVDLTP